MRSYKAWVHRIVVVTVLACAAWLASPNPAGAQGIVFRLPGLGPTSFTFTNTTIAAFRTTNFNNNPNDDNVFALTERFDSAFSAPPWRLQVRIDAFVPIFTQIRSFDLSFPDQAAMRANPGSWMYPAQFDRSTWTPFGGAPYDFGSCNPVSPCFLRWDARPERFALRYQRGIITAEIGDVYSVLGRGLVASFRKVDPLGLDTTVRGGRFEIEAGRVTIRAFGGLVNPQNLDPLTMHIYEDTQTPGRFARARPRLPWWDYPQDYDMRFFHDWLVGGDVTARFGPDEDVEMAVQTVHVQAPEDASRERGVDVIGYRVSAPSLFDGALALHLEVNGLRRSSWTYATSMNAMRPSQIDRGAFQRFEDEFGRAIFAAAQVTTGNWNMNFEWKDYRNYLVSPDGTSGDARRVYSAAPSLERFDVQFRSNSNTRGGRFQIEHAFRPSPWSLSTTVASSAFTEDNSVDPWADFVRQAGAAGFGGCTPSMGDCPARMGLLHGYVTLRRRGRPAPRPPSAAPASSSGSGATGAGGSGTGESGAGGTASSGASGFGGGTTGGIGASGPRVAAGEWALSTTVGYRHEFLLNNQRAGMNAMRAGGAPDWQVVHADLDVTFALSPNVSLEVVYDVRFETRWQDYLEPITGSFDFCPSSNASDTARYYCYLRTGLTATLSITDRLQISSVFRFDNSQRVLRGGFDYPVVYPAGEVRWMFTPGSTLRFFGGMTPGGRLCSGGVCRDVPPFQGGLMELVLRI